MLGKTEYWWVMDESMEEIRRQLLTNNYVVIPSFLLDEQCRELKGYISQAQREGRMGPGALAGGITGENLSYSIANVRGDNVGWFEGETEVSQRISLALTIFSQPLAFLPTREFPHLLSPIPSLNLLSPLGSRQGWPLLTQYLRFVDTVVSLLGETGEETGVPGRIDSESCLGDACLLEAIFLKS